MALAVLSLVMGFGATGSAAANGVVPLVPSVHASNGSGNATGGWTQLTPGASPPGIAAGAAMAYDPVDGYDVLFGGCTSGDYWYSACTPSNATWTYQSGTWVQLFPAVSPPARFYSSMTWDGEAVLLFGGNSTTSFLNDTWTFLHGNWTQVQSTLSPPARAGAAMTFDAATDSTILFGGEAYRTLVSSSSETYAGADYHDTWSFAGGQWTQLHPATSPGARDSASIGYDPQSEQVVLFGGFNWSSYNQADTWTFNGTDWSPSNASGPAARNGGAMAYDPTLAGLVLFGGHDGWSLYNDTWLFTGGNWTPLNLSSAPSPRWGASEAIDASGCLLLFGGFAAATVATAGTFYSDTWTLCSIGSGGNGTGSSGSGGTGNSTGGSGNSTGGSGNSTGGTGNSTGNTTGGVGGGGSNNSTAPSSGIPPAPVVAPPPPPPPAPRVTSPSPSSGTPSTAGRTTGGVVLTQGVGLWALLVLLAGVGIGFVISRRPRRPRT